MNRLVLGSAVLVAAVVAVSLVKAEPMSVVVADYGSVVLADNPLGYWRLGESSGPVAYDASDSGLHGLYIGGITLGQQGALVADENTSVLFDGETSYVNVGTPSSLNQLTNDFTIEAWTLGESHDGTIVSTRRGSAGAETGYGFGFARDVEGVFFCLYGSSNKIHRLSMSAPTDEWLHLVVVFDASNDASFYVNGELAGTSLGSLAAIPNSQEFHIGRSPGPNHIGEYGYFGGQMDEVAVYSRSLAPEEIREHYLAAVPEPSTIVLLITAALGLLFRRLRRR